MTKQPGKLDEGGTDYMAGKLEGEVSDSTDVFSGDFWADAKLKWESGRRRYGPNWAGSTALREAYKEQLDTYNYAGRALEEGIVSIAESEELKRLSVAVGELIFGLILRSRAQSPQVVTEGADG